MESARRLPFCPPRSARTQTSSWPDGRPHGLLRNGGIYKTDWVWTKDQANHEDNNRCDWLAQTAARMQAGSWPDNRRHARLRLDLGREYVPPRPQASLFAGAGADDAGDEDEDEPAVLS